ncbi:membrane protein FxsA [Rhizobium rosettiformans]|uniref:Membrane protein FxsA n=1 Tax=Rhizobium rosettiformans TaxID=1368430 RepID=A0ABX7EUT6_9HYPH|nr:FxsA family protein [Rhizobium rosettiformans]ODS54017.1 MAG: membrane protein FxsA [Agrobacterium sp. SCN 61-19]QRF51033.1 membrane protein FxsA [Rhizobium rosettiformans]
MRLPLVLFLIAPLVEIASFILVGQAIGVLPTLGLIILAAFAGVILLRYQGAGILRRLQSEAQRGMDPGRELVHGALLVVAAFLLIVPGFFGDIIGILLFLPFVRDLAWRLIKPRLIVRSSFSDAGFRTSRPSDENVVDLGDDEYQREPDRNSPWRDPRIGRE